MPTRILRVDGFGGVEGNGFNSTVSPLHYIHPLLLLSNNDLAIKVLQIIGINKRFNNINYARFFCLSVEFETVNLKR
jgi:hypothetical protein